MNIEIKGLEGKELNPNHFGGMCSRDKAILVFTKREDGEDDLNEGIDTIATTEDPAIVVDWEKWRMVREILPMRYCELPDNDKAPLLNAHSRKSIEDVKGSAVKWKTENDLLVCRTVISETEKDVQTKIKEGHIDSVSIGYLTDESRTVEIPKKASILIDGKEFKNDYEDDTPLLVRTWWKIKELSLVPIGADAAAKFRAELQSKTNSLPGQITSEDPELQKKLDQLQNEITSVKNLNQDLNIKLNERGNIMSEPIVPTPDEIRKAEQDRIADIESYAVSPVAKNYKAGKEALEAKRKEAIQNNWTADQFRGHVYDNFDDTKPTEKFVTDLDMSEKDCSKLSIGKYLNAAFDHAQGKSDAFKDAGLEKEAVEAATKRALTIEGKTQLRGGVLPWDFFKNKEVTKYSKLLSERTSAGIGISLGANLIAAQHFGDQFIDIVRNLGVAGPWGVRNITAGNGTIQIPKKTSSGTFHWVAERGTGTATDFVIGQLTAAPNDGWSSMAYGRRALLLSNPSLDALILDDILQNIIAGRDKALLHGAGSDEPTGIAITSGVGGVTGASLDWDAIVEFWTDVATNNLNTANSKFVMNALTAGILMTRPVVSGGYLGFLMDMLNKIGGAIVSNQANNGYLFYGDGSEAAIVDWGVIDILVNPYLNATGDVTITGFTSMDVLVSRADAFSVASDVS